LAKALDCRPKNTNKAFDRKQKEFISWAVQQGYCQPKIVTEKKLALFLQTEVLKRQWQNSKNETKIIGKPTVMQYISAITSLWKHQCLMKKNSNPTPRGESVKQILSSIDAEAYKTRKETYFDRGHLYQHLMSTEMKQNCLMISNYFWNYGGESTFHAFKGLQNQLGYLLSEQGLIHGETVRDLQLPDFFSVEYDDEGPTLCKAMVILKGCGKTNHFGKALFSGYYHHSNVRLCAVSATAYFYSSNTIFWVNHFLISLPQDHGTTLLCFVLTLGIMGSQ
jgi:hypothetical protein